MPPSMDLLQKAKDDIFKNREEVEVITAVEVQQCALTAALLNRNKKTARQALGELRVVIVSGEFDKGNSRIKLNLLNCSTSGARLQVKRGYSIAALKSVTVVRNDGAARLFALGLAFGSSGRETELTFQAQNEETLFKLLCPLWYYVKRHRQSQNKKPTLTALPERRGEILNQIADWNARYLDQSIERRLLSRQAGHKDDADQNTSAEESEAEETRSGSRLFMSAKEENDLQQLMTRFEVEVNDIAGFEQRLQQELSFLEADNVQTILQSTEQVSKVRDSLNDALALLDDVNENLATFDTKLLVMREDIAAIENRNNRLELQTRNDGKLLTALDRLLDKLTLSPETERRLRQMSFGSRNREPMIEAGWELYDHFHSLGESVKDSQNKAGLGSYGIANMTAVLDQKQKFKALTKTYVDQAAEYVGVELLNKTTSQLQLSLAQHEARKEPHLPDLFQLHQDVDDLTSLVHVATTMQPGIIKKITHQYTQAFNTMLRKQLRLYTSDLKKDVQKKISALPSDVALLKGIQVRRKEGQLTGEALSEKMNSLQTINSRLSPTISPSGSPKKGGQGSPRKSGLFGEFQSKSAAAFKLSEAWSQLLQDWIPLLLTELDCCADFLNFKEDDVQYSKELEASMENLSAQHHETEDTHDSHNELAHGKESLQPRLSAIGVNAIEHLMKDMSVDFFTIVDIVAKQQQLQAIPMLSITLKWKAKVKTLPMAYPLYILLHQCTERLLSSFKQCVTDMEEVLHRFEGRYHHKDGLKHVHVVPFIESFPNLVSYTDELLQSSLKFKPVFTQNSGLGDIEENEEALNGYVEEEDDFHAEEEEEDFFKQDSITEDMYSNTHNGSVGINTTGGSSRVKSLQRGSLPGRGINRASIMGALKRSSLHKASGGPGQLERAANNLVGRPISEIEGDRFIEDNEARLRQLTVAEIPDDIPELRLIQSVKDVVDPAYAMLSRAMFSTVDEIGLRDSKHGERVKMENYLAFADVLSHHAEENTILDYFVRDAKDRGNDAIEAYIKQQMEYAKVWRLVEFSQGVDTMLLQVGQDEFTFQTGFQPADFQQLLANTVNTTLPKRLAGIKTRMTKHVGGDQELLQMIWLRFQNNLKVSCGNLYNTAESLYPNMSPPPSPSDLDIMFSNIDHQQSGTQKPE